MVNMIGLYTAAQYRLSNRWREIAEEDFLIARRGSIPRLICVVIRENTLYPKSLSRSTDVVNIVFAWKFVGKRAFLENNYIVFEIMWGEQHIGFNNNS